MVGETGRVSVEADGHVLLIGIDRPAKLNAFTPEMMAELCAAYDRLEADDEVRCAVLYAEGPSFTGGPARIAEQAPLAVQATRGKAVKAVMEGQRAAIAELARTQARLAASEDAAEGVAALVERRAGTFKGR